MCLVSGDKLSIGIGSHHIMPCCSAQSLDFEGYRSIQRYRQSPLALPSYVLRIEVTGGLGLNGCRNVHAPVNNLSKRALKLSKCHCNHWKHKPLSAWPLRS
jgi:hypothetical protein